MLNQPVLHAAALLLLGTVFFLSAASLNAAAQTQEPPPPEDAPPVLEDLSGPGPEAWRDERPGKRREDFRRRKHQRSDDGPRYGRGAGAGRPEGRMGQFLHLVKQYQAAVQDPYQATSLAVLGVKQHYKRINKPEEAVLFFDSQLKNIKDQKMRNVFLFAIRQTYEETRDANKLLAVNKQIIEENLRNFTAK